MQYKQYYIMLFIPKSRFYGNAKKNYKIIFCFESFTYLPTLNKIVSHIHDIKMSILKPCMIVIFLIPLVIYFIINDIIYCHCRLEKHLLRVIYFNRSEQNYIHGGNQLLYLL